MKRITLNTLTFLSLAGLLAACTGTEEDAPAIRLALMTDGGATLRTITPNPDTASTPITGNQTLPVTGGASLNTSPDGRRLYVTLAAGLESRNADLADVQPFAAPPNPPFASVCLRQTAASAARDRLLTLSVCPNGPQQLALYRNDGTLVWTALLPTFLPPAAGTDAPPIRLAVLGDTGVVARPVVGGGSEVMRAAQANLGDLVAVVSTPVNTPSIRDLAPYGGDILAATDSGILKLSSSGVPDSAVTPPALSAAFGNARFDRLWSGVVGGRTLLAAWRSNLLNNPSLQPTPLLLWDGVKTSALTVDSLDDLRDLTFSLDGYLYALTRTNLIRYDTVFGLSNSNWRPKPLLGTLNDARAVTWVVP